MAQRNPHFDGIFILSFHVLLTYLLLLAKNYAM